MFRRLALGPEGDSVHGPDLDPAHHLLHDRSGKGFGRRGPDDGAVVLVEGGREGIVSEQKFCSRDARIHLRRV